MVDEFSTDRSGLTAPATAGETITPNDQTDLTFVTRALYVGTPGDIHLTLLSGTEITLVSAQAGAFYPLRAVRVMASGTTADNLVGLR